MAGFLTLVAIIVIYFLPTILARNKRNRLSVFALNLLLGWTVIGWIVALVWGLRSDARTTQVMVRQEPVQPLAASQPESELVTSSGTAT